jgi:hypothetical protein
MSTCKRAQPLIPGDKGAYQSCLDDEIEAQKELSRKWFRFTARQHIFCTRDTVIGGAPSFVELLTCMELDQQAAQARIENAKPLKSPISPAVPTPRRPRRGRFGGSSATFGHLA